MYIVETFSDFLSETFGSLRKSSEMIGNIQMTFGQLSDNLDEIYCYSEFFIVIAKCVKFRPSQWGPIF